MFSHKFYKLRIVYSREPCYYVFRGTVRENVTPGKTQQYLGKWKMHNALTIYIHICLGNGGRMKTPGGGLREGSLTFRYVA